MNQVTDFSVENSLAKELDTAGFFLRLFALLIDLAIISLVSILLKPFLGSFSGEIFSFFNLLMGDLTNQGLMAVLLNSFLILTGLTFLGLIYFCLLEASPLRATLGKFALGIVVADSNGNRVSIAKTLFRNFIKLFSWLIFGFGFLIALGKEKQAFHDIVSGCKVMKKPNFAPVLRVAISMLSIPLFLFFSYKSLPSSQSFKDKAISSLDIENLDISELDLQNLDISELNIPKEYGDMLRDKVPELNKLLEAFESSNGSPSKDSINQESTELKAPALEEKSEPVAKSVASSNNELPIQEQVAVATSQTDDGGQRLKVGSKSWAVKDKLIKLIETQSGPKLYFIFFNEKLSQSFRDSFKPIRTLAKLTSLYSSQKPSPAFILSVEFKEQSEDCQPKAYSGVYLDLLEYEGLDVVNIEYPSWRLFQRETKLECLLEPGSSVQGYFRSGRMIELAGDPTLVAFRLSLEGKIE